MRVQKPLALPLQRPALPGNASAHECTGCRAAMQRTCVGRRLRGGSPCGSESELSAGRGCGLRCSAALAQRRDERRRRARVVLGQEVDAGGDVLRCARQAAQTQRQSTNAKRKRERAQAPPDARLNALGAPAQSLAAWRARPRLARAPLPRLAAARWAQRPLLRRFLAPLRRLRRPCASLPRAPRRPPRSRAGRRRRRRRRGGCRRRRGGRPPPLPAARARGTRPPRAPRRHRRRRRRPPAAQP